MDGKEGFPRRGTQAYRLLELTAICGEIPADLVRRLPGGISYKESVILSLKKARHLLTRLDKAHIKYYKYYTGRNWGKARNYDLCINSASYGIQGSVDLIMRMISQEK